MKICVGFLLASLVLLVSPATFAANRAVIINIGSIGVGIDAAVIRTVRQIVGYAVANGTVGKFVVDNVHIPIEGGLTACAEVGKNVTSSGFNSLIQDLKSITPKFGTVYSITATGNCSKFPAP